MSSICHKDMMKRQIKEVLTMRRFLKAALITGFLTLAVGNLVMQPQPANSQNQTKRPSQLVRLTPEEKARTVNPDATISASFDLSRGPHPILLPSVKLIIDGVEVTQQARVAATDDFPPSRAEISFKPDQPFSAGKHIAEIRFANDQNRQSSYTWEFYVPGVTGR
jgi:hypothetical protein